MCVTDVKLNEPELVAEVLQSTYQGTVSSPVKAWASYPGHGRFEEGPGGRGGHA